MNQLQIIADAIWDIINDVYDEYGGLNSLYVSRYAENALNIILSEGESERIYKALSDAYLLLKENGVLNEIEYYILVTKKLEY